MRFEITGIVQGVGFRPAVFRAAEKVGASGTVRNDGSHVTVETDRADLIDALMEDLPPLARIDSVTREDSEYAGPEGFSIIPSDGTGRGASIPADTAVCDECVKEMMSAGRRHAYPFTTCTSCGPRFTLLESIPYDRIGTSMSAFPVCPECGAEFADPRDRRFHHQTIACPACGPSYRLVTREGTIADDPIGTLAEMLDEGKRAVVKGWGGSHICCIPERIPELRGWYGRPQKPFALMARDIASLRKYGDPTPDEERLLLSPQRPIVLVRKRDCEAAELAAPGLDTVGMFLPYTGMHHILFSKLEHDALVMTSANPPGEPMAVKDEDALRLDADAWLLHDQPIVNRADDTVMCVHDGRCCYLRRSRGAVPSFIDSGVEGSVVALGSQENLTGAVAVDGRIWPTQYIGNGEKIGVPEYLEEAVRRQMSLAGCVPEAVAVDLHPGHANRRLGRALSEEYDAEFIEVQHHWAHAASLMADAGVDKCVALTLDGTGYGTDGTVWGGEVLDADMHGFERTGHLQPIPLLGSDRALYDLRRLRFAVDAINGDDNSDFTDRESSVLLKMMPKSIQCSSMGRFLDTLAYSLGICNVRTYDGEPAMKLEALMNRGKLVEGYDARTKRGVVQTAELFTRIDGKNRKEDVAYSMVHGVMSELVSLAAERAASKGVRHIGLTGGVSYNLAISRMFEDMVKSSGFVPVFHSEVPNGDGGISVGQAAIALRKIS